MGALVVALALGCGGSPRADAALEPAAGSVAPDEGAPEPAFAVAVTIDDLPFAGPPRPGDTVDGATARLLGHASAAAAPVTGFVNCDRLDGDAPVARAWLAAGATLGNHTAGHVSFDAEEPGGWRAHVGSCRRRLEALVGRPPRWFRYPYLQRGATPSRRAEGARVLRELGHEVAPVTIDTSDWALASAYVAALRAGDAGRAQQVVEAFLDHVRAATRRYRTLARRRFGREVAQVLLLHANALVADHLGELLAALREEGARFVTLDEAMEDPVYAMPDTYVGPVGLSWLLRIGPEPERGWRWDHAQLEGIQARFTDRVGPRDARVGTHLRWRTLTEGAWVVTHEGLFDAHSLVVEVADGTLVLADTPPTEAATIELLDWLRARFGRRPLVAIDGHFHLDATGGNAAVSAAGGRVIASDLTARLLAAHGASGREALAAMARDAGNDALAARFAETTIAAPTETFPLAECRTLAFGGERVQVVHPGPAHTDDNVVVFFPDRGLLFGGCMVIGMDAVGYTGDADLARWPDAIRRLQRLNAQHVVPGHGTRFSPAVLDHTLRLLETYRPGPPRP